MHAPRLAAALAFAFLLAGCTQPAGDASPSPTATAMAQGVALAAGQALAPANLTAVTAHASAWFNGTSAASDFQACVLSTCDSSKDVDLTPFLERGAWARLNVTLRWSDPAEDATWDAIAGHVLYAWVEAPADEIVSYQETHEAGLIEVRTVLRHAGDGPVLARVGRNFAGSGATTDYTLHVEAAPFGFAAYAPLALEAHASARTLVAHAPRPGGAIRVWDGADRFVGAFPIQAPVTRIDLANLTKGEPVLQVVDAPAGLRFSVLQDAGAAPPRLRPLGFVRAFGALQDVPPNGAVDWSFDVAKVPLWLGMVLQAKGGNGNGCLSLSSPATCYATVQGTGFIRSPAGTVVEVEWNCYFCGGQARIGSEVGDAALVAGTYQAHYEDAAAANFQVGDYQVAYVR